MKNLPIVGTTVTAVEPGYVLHIYLSRKGQIAIEDPFVILGTEGKLVIDPTDGNPDVRELSNLIIGSTVMSAAYGPHYELFVSFSSDVCIQVDPNRDGYESWNVHDGTGYVMIGSRGYGPAED